MRLRRMSAWLYVASLGLYALGAAFAFLLPRL
jgi:hypothetical protein